MTNANEATESPSESSAFGIWHSAFRSGFTLVEIVISLTIIIIIAAGAVPTVAQRRAAAAPIDEADIPF